MRLTNYPNEKKCFLKITITFDNLLINKYINVNGSLLNIFIYYNRFSLLKKMASSRARTQFTEEQSRVLEDMFKDCYYPNSDTKKALATRLDLPEHRITVRLRIFNTTQKSFFHFSRCGFKIDAQNNVDILKKKWV